MYFTYHSNPLSNLVITFPLIKYSLWDSLVWKITEVNHITFPAAAVEDRRLLIVYPCYLYLLLEYLHLND